MWTRKISIMANYNYVNEWRMRHPSKEMNASFVEEILAFSHVRYWVFSMDSDVLTPTGANNPYLSAPVAPWVLIRTALKRLKMSQSELAQSLGVSRTFMTLMLRGERPISMAHALAIQEAICVPAHVLLRLQADYELYLHYRKKEGDE